MSFFVSPAADSTSEAETKRGGDTEGRDREEGALNKERKKRKKAGKEAVIRLRPSRMKAEAGKEPDTRGDTRTLVLCSTCCQAAFHRAREPHSTLHTISTYRLTFCTMITVSVCCCTESHGCCASSGIQHLAETCVCTLHCMVAVASVDSLSGC